LFQGYFIDVSKILAYPRSDANDIDNTPTSRALKEAYETLSSLANEPLSKFTLRELLWIVADQQRLRFSNEVHSLEFRDAMVALAERVHSR
jgi:hypothetical protein